LRCRVLPLNPDLVILYEANNDIAYDTRKLAQDQGLVGSLRDERSSVVSLLSAHSVLFDLTYKNSKMLLAQCDAQSGTLDSVPHDLRARFIGEVAKIHSLLRSSSIPMVMSTFLVKYRRDQDRSSQRANADVAFYYMPWMSLDDLLDASDYYNDAIVAYAHAE